MKQVKVVNRGKYPLQVEKELGSEVKVFNLYPNQPTFLAEPVAELFAKTYSDVEIVPGASLEEDFKLVDTRVWLANNTGHPKFAVLVDKYYDNYRIKGTKTYEKRSVEYRQATPQTLTWKWNAGEVVYEEEDKTIQVLQKPFTKIVLEPFERRPFDKAQASWMLNQVRTDTPDMHECVIRSREPSSFEPNMDWTYEDMRLYASLCHVDFKNKEFLGPTQEEIRESEPNKEAFEIALVDAKYQLYCKLYFYLIDPAVQLPTEKMFRMYSDKKEDVTQRRVGRPPVKHKEESPQA